MLRSKGTKASLMVFVLLVSGTAFAFSVSAANGPRLDSWTVALYVAADNNLEQAWDQYTLPALLGIPASKKVNIVALVDLYSTKETKLLEFSGDSYKEVETSGESNTGDGTVFSSFLDKVELMYPAENMCVIPWNHGGSWRGFCSDDTSDGDIIRMNEFSTALTEAALPIDILAFDACVMSGVEIVYEAYATDLVKYVIASEMYIPFDGFPYDLMFTPLVENPEMTPEELYATMLVGWDAYYHCGRQLNLVVTDVAAMGAGIDAYKDWSEALLEGLDEYGDEYTASFAAAAGNEYTNVTPDVYDLCVQLIANVDDEGIADACKGVMEAVDGAVAQLHTGGWAQAMHGLSIWWPSEYYYTYKDFNDQYPVMCQFAAESGWSDFMEAYFLWYESP